QYAVACGVEVLAVDLVGTATHREQRSFVHQVREVGTAHAGRAARDNLDVHVGIHLLVAHVDFQNLDPFVLRGKWHEDLAVKTTRTQQRGVEDVGAVRGGHHDDAL